MATDARYGRNGHESRLLWSSVQQEVSQGHKRGFVRGIKPIMS